MKELNVVLSNLKPLQALLSTIMNDSHFSTFISIVELELLNKGYINYA